MEGGYAASNASGSCLGLLDGSPTNVGVAVLNVEEVIDVDPIVASTGVPNDRAVAIPLAYRRIGAARCARRGNPRSAGRGVGRDDECRTGLGAECLGAAWQRREYDSWQYSRGGRAQRRERCGNSG